MAGKRLKLVELAGGAVAVAGGVWFGVAPGQGYGAPLAVLGVAVVALARLVRWWQAD